jgi:hypothetical protein
LGVGLAAVQLLPLREIATQTYRGAGLDIATSAPNSVWPGDVVTLLLPHLHDVGNRDYWGPWVKWETVLYVGVAPLILAAVGLLWSNGRHRGFFGALMGLSLLCAFGSYGPLPLWDTLHQLPGFNVLKSPGRFSLLFALGVAVCAGYGAERLARSKPSPPAGVLVLLVTLVLSTMAGVGLALSSAKLQSWARTDSLLVEEYLRMPGVPRSVEAQPLTYDRLALYAADALSPRNARTVGQLALLAASGLMVSLWQLGGRAHFFAASLTLTLVFVDLLTIGLEFHPTIPVGDLRARPPDFLRAKSGEVFRVLTRPTTDEKVTQVDPNRLLAAGIQEAGGYSSLPPDRAAAYLSNVMETDDDLLNLWNVRYLLRQRRPEPQPGYEGVSFHPTRPLFRGKEGDQGRAAAFLPDGGPAPGDELFVVASLVNARGVGEGEAVAQLRLEGTEGESRELRMLAGRDVSDATIDVPGAAGFAHSQAEVAFDHQRTDPQGERYGHRLFFARLPTGERFTLRRATVEQTMKAGRLHVFGIGWFDRETGDLTQVWEHEDRPQVFANDEIAVEENLSVLPRAFLVSQATSLGPGVNPLQRMHDGPFDPRRVAVVEGPLPDGVTLPSAADITAVDRRADRVDMLEYHEERVVLQSHAAASALLLLQDAYFPGWVARVDGEQVPILPTNYLFRGVVVPSGDHQVVFSYEPRAVAWGLIITLISAGVILSVAIFGVVARLRALRRRAD